MKKPIFREQEKQCQGQRIVLPNIFGKFSVIYLILFAFWLFSRVFERKVFLFVSH
ncbi:MAG: hypothetical protein J5858_12075 [Lentisphaeria bacterium]|nr:hypothetical protein [Lentisphaeria bacterium]